MHGSYDGFKEFLSNLLELSLTKRIIIIIVSSVVAYFGRRMHIRATLKGKAHWGARGFWTIWLFPYWAGVWFAAWTVLSLLYQYLKNIF